LCLSSRSEVSTVDFMSCDFDTLRREDLLGNAMLCNLRLCLSYCFTIQNSGRTCGADNT